MRGKVLITCRQMQSCLDQFRDRIEGAGYEIVAPEISRQQLSEAELSAIIGEFDGIIAGDDPLTAEVLSHAGRMRVISKWGVGTDGIDFAAAAERGIVVTNTPGAFGDDVADVAAGYMVMLARQLHVIHQSIVDGGWHKHEGRRLAGSTLGVIGFGSIGQAIGRRGIGFGMEVLAQDANPNLDGAAQEIRARMVDLDELLAASDFIALAAPLLPETRHVMNERAFGLLKPGAFLINVSRGPLVDESALVAALESGKVAAAALDVFETEPLPLESELRRFTQCVFGSHNGSFTHEGTVAASARAVDNLLRELSVA